MHYEGSLAASWRREERPRAIFCRTVAAFSAWSSISTIDRASTQDMLLALRTGKPRAGSPPVRTAFVSVDGAVLASAARASVQDSVRRYRPDAAAAGRVGVRGSARYRPDSAAAGRVGVQDTVRRYCPDTAAAGRVGVRGSVRNRPAAAGAAAGAAAVAATDQYQGQGRREDG